MMRSSKQYLYSLLEHEIVMIVCKRLLSIGLEGIAGLGWKVHAFSINTDLIPHTHIYTLHEDTASKISDVKNLSFNFKNSVIFVSIIKL